MRTNSDRSRWLTFDSVPDSYERGRPRYADEVVDTLIEWSNIRHGDHVLEIGAGTGQLTVPLVRRGLVVEALEPGPRLARVLRDNLMSEPATGTRVTESTFESFDSTCRYAAVLAANSFHWVDPAVGFRRAADLLTDRGTLGLMWNYPILSDSGLQRRLNESIFTDVLDDLRRDPDRHLADVEQALADGRAELTRSDRFAQPRWSLVRYDELWPAAQYISFLVSLASVVDQAPLIDLRVREALGSPVAVAITNRVYISVSRRAGSANG